MNKNKIFRPASVINFEKLMDARNEIIRLKEECERVNNIILEQRREIEKINNNWNKLKQWVLDSKVDLYMKTGTFFKIFFADEILNKMEEIKGSDKE